MSKFCGNCGQQYEEGALFCPNCGAKLEDQDVTINDNAENKTEFEQFTENTAIPEMGAIPTPEFSSSDDVPVYAGTVDGVNPNTANPSVVLAVISMVLGIISLLCCCWFGAIGILFSLAAVVIGIISIATKKGGKGMAIAGIVCGAIALILSIFTATLTSLVTNDLIGNSDFNEIIEEIIDEYT